MRVLDLDLDLFLADCCPLAPLGERPAPAGHEPWAADAVTDFLERGCGLSVEDPVPGAIFSTHDGALSFWADRIADGSLTAPFHVTHADAHSDLGIGHPGPGYVLNCVLPQPLSMRRDIARHAAMRELDEANYLLFAIAFRYIASLDNVRNARSRPDISEAILSPGRTDEIRLTSFPALLTEPKNGKEPRVPLRTYDDPHAFIADAPYDFVTLAHSPRYAPAAADALIPIIARYIKPISSGVRV